MFSIIELERIKEKELAFETLSVISRILINTTDSKIKEYIINTSELS